MSVQGLRPGTPPTAADLAAAKAARELDETTLQRVRGASERWRTGAGITAAVAAVLGLIAGPDTIRDHSFGVKLAIGFSLGVAVVLVVISVALAMRASYGWPTEVPNDREKRAIWTAAETRRSVRFLKISMVLAVPSIVALAVAGALVLFGAPAPAGLKIILINGSSVCADSIQRQGSDLVRIDGKQAITLSTDEIASIASSEPCD